VSTKHPFLSFFSPLLPALFLFSLQIPLFDQFSTDDAFISYRYAQNLLEGHGLLFNPGDPPVEGYTNFLWTVLLAATALSGVNLEYLGPVLSIFFGIGSIIALRTLIPKNLDLSSVALLTALLPASAGFVLWSLSGMETTFFIFLLLLSISRSRIESDRSLKGYRSGLLWGLCALTRPEGIVFGPLFSFLYILERGVTRAEIRIGLERLSVSGLLVCSHFLWRYSFYGAWLPNTFHAKTGSISLLAPLGIEYTIGFVCSGALIPLIVALVIRPTPIGCVRQVFPWIGIILFQFSYVILVGGDWMPGFRFFQVILPAVSLLTALALSGRRSLERQIALSISLLLVLPLSLYSMRDQIPGSTYHRIMTGKPPQPDVLKALGLYLSREFPADTLLAVVPAGKVPYYSGFRAIDMRGLCDSTIARSRMTATEHAVAGHMKRDPAYVLSLEPDVIVTSGTVRKPGIPLEPLVWRKGHFMDRWEILEEPEFKRWYRPIRVEMPSGDKDLQFFVRQKESS